MKPHVTFPSVLFLSLSVAALGACSDGDAETGMVITSPIPTAAGGSGTGQPAAPEGQGGQPGSSAQAGGPGSSPLGGAAGLPLGGAAGLPLSGGTTAGGTDTSGTSASGTSTSGTSTGGTSAGGTDASGTSAGGMSAGGTAPDLTTGEGIYVALCVDCHGADATGASDADGKKLGPDARHPEEAYTKYLIREGSEARGTAGIYAGPMLKLGPAVLSDQQVEMVLAYLNDRSLFPQPTTGEELYLDYCAACHAADGSGVPTGRPLTKPDVTVAKTKMLVRDGVHTNMPHDKKEFMPKRSVADISDAELELIAEYVDKF